MKGLQSRQAWAKRLYHKHNWSKTSWRLGSNGGAPSYKAQSPDFMAKKKEKKERKNKSQEKKAVLYLLVYFLKSAPYGSDI
jgi:hypothetical protein